MAERLGLSRSQMVVALLLAVVLVVLAFLQRQPESMEPYDPAGTDSTGLRALVLWLEELGHPVKLLAPGSTLAAETGLLWVHSTGPATFSPAYEADFAAIYEWVGEGGTLVIVGGNPSFALSERFDVRQVATFTDLVSDTRQVQPLLPDAPSRWSSVFASYNLEFFTKTAIVPLLAHANGEPVVALQFIGEGVVWHLTEDFALTNLHLRDERVASLLPAILRVVPQGAPATFSTHHLTRYQRAGEEGNEVGTLQDWLYTTPFGQGTLLLMVATFVYLLLQGRRLGPALPGPTATRPREAAEYVVALAGLQRRMRQPHLVADHHRQRLKGAVGRLAQLPADLPDAEWLAQLRRAEVLSPADMNGVAELLSGYARMDGNSDDESGLIQLVRATDALLASLPRANMKLVR